MIIVHICLACFYYEGMGYQENLLPKYQAELNQIFILTPLYMSSYMKNGEVRNTAYTNIDGIEVRILNRSTRHGYFSRFVDYDGIQSDLNEIKPDIVFVHGGQSIALNDVIDYCSSHRQTKLFIDQHGDYYNMPVNTLKARIVQKYIYGHWMRKAVKYTTKFWGVTPWRCEYLRDVYKIPENKIGLLVMGGDDDKIHFNDKIRIRHEIREKLDISENDFVFITGGKIDKEKNIHVLMQAVSELKTEKIKLIVFGSPDQEMQATISKLSENTSIRSIGWISADSVYDYFLASDVGIFPGTHSVLWEQACATGLPCLFKNWTGMHHVDVGGNCLFINHADIDEIKEKMLLVYKDHDMYNKMKKNAEDKAVVEFSYRKIAQKAIGML